jgi:transposase
VLALEFFGGVPRRIVLDNLADGVLKPDIYDPMFNRAYAELCRPRGYADQPSPGTRSLDVPGLVARVTPCGAA